MVKLPTPRQLHYFLALVETLSFSRAAELCHVTQSTLSNALNELEDTIGEKLIDRGTRRVSLTPAGYALVFPIQDILEQLSNLTHIASIQYRNILSTRLILGIIPTIAPYLLPKILSGAQKNYPNLDLRVKEDITSRQLDSLRKGRIDAVLMAFPYDAPEFDFMSLWKEPFFLASSQKPKNPDFLKISDLKGENILLLEDGHCLRDHVIQSCQLHNLLDSSGLQRTTNKAFGATSLQTLVQMVQHGYGATLLPAMAIDPDNFPKSLYIQRFENPQPYREIVLGWRESDPRAQEFRALGNLIIEACEKIRAA